MSAHRPRTAVVFRTHLWDAFVQRQFLRLQEIAQGCDVYVLVDESAGPVSGITHDRVIRITAADLVAKGFARAGEGNLLWYNGDYPLYTLLTLAPGYDYYFQTEYDAVISVPIADLAEQAASRGFDVVALTKGPPSAEWYWLASCTDAYRLPDIRHQLICISLFSAASLAFLRQRRLELSREHVAGRLRRWPICEGFIPTELAAGGFRTGELSEFGDTAAYDHWPPYLESDLGRADAGGFMHPVLDRPRYVDSVLKYHVGLAGYLDPNSLLHRKLRRLPLHFYLQALFGSFLVKVARRMGAPVSGSRLFA